MAPEVDRKTFRDLSYGLCLVTSFEGDRLNGQVVNTVIQVTSEPPRVAVIINRKNLTCEFIVKSKVFGVSVLDESAPMTYHYYHEHLKGKSPKNAPTYEPLPTKDRETS